MITIIVEIIKTKDNEIHNGLNIHHQDHVIILVNFNAMNSIVSNPANPIPLDVFVILI